DCASGASQDDPAQTPRRTLTEGKMRLFRIPLKLILLVVWLSVMMAGKTTEPQCKETLQLPETVKAALKRMPDIVVSCRLKSAVIQGDFDGDGKVDYAVLVTKRASQKRGFL